MIYYIVFWFTKLCRQHVSSTSAPPSWSSRPCWNKWAFQLWTSSSVHNQILWSHEGINWLVFGIFRIMANTHFHSSVAVFLGRFLSSIIAMVLYQLVSCAGVFRCHVSTGILRAIPPYGSFFAGEFSVLLVLSMSLLCQTLCKLMLLAAVVCVKQSSPDVPHNWILTPYPTHQDW